MVVLTYGLSLCSYLQYHLRRTSLHGSHRKPLPSQWNFTFSILVQAVDFRLFDQVNSNVTGNDPYTAVADMIVDDVDTIYILGYCQALAGAGISDGTVTYFVEQTSC